MTQGSWIEQFKGLAGLPEDVKDALTARSAIVRFSAGDIVFGHGQIPNTLLLLLSGVLRVRQYSASGREIVLYRVEAGQSCVLTTACLLAQEYYSAEGYAETDIEAASIPRDVFDDLMARSETFRSFVFAAYARRISDLIHVIDDVAFGRIDVRLAQRLTLLARGGAEVRATHQDLATELGTAREVISRQLQEFQRRGWISQTRGRIALEDAKALTQLGEQ